MSEKTAAERRADLEERISLSAERLKVEMLMFSAKLIVAAVIFLGTTGYFFLNQAISTIYYQHHKEIIDELRAKYDELRAKYDTNILQEQMHFQWARTHDFGKNYIYLAELDSLSAIEPKEQLLKACFDRARSYFQLARTLDPKQATTYWELGELYYTYPRKYHLPNEVNDDKALDFYQRATEYYSDSDAVKGWRADAYRMIGKIFYEKAHKTPTTRKDSEKNTRQLLEEAREYLEKARTEYDETMPGFREYHQGDIAEVGALIADLKSPRKR